jgi:hypothetical protein
MNWYKINEDKSVEMIPDGNFPTQGEFETIHRRVGDDKIDGQRVSTVFLSLDHNWSGGEPLLFETMIFNGPYDTYMERYSTYDQAKAGHERIVNCLKNGINPNE